MSSGQPPAPERYGVAVIVVPMNVPNSARVGKFGFVPEVRAHAGAHRQWHFAFHSWHENKCIVRITQHGSDTGLEVIYGIQFCSRDLNNLYSVALLHFVGIQFWS